MRRIYANDLIYDDYYDEENTPIVLVRRSNRPRLVSYPSRRYAIVTEDELSSNYLKSTTDDKRHHQSYPQGQKEADKYYKELMRMCERLHTDDVEKLCSALRYYKH